jgi:hypothetical protein
MARLPTPTSQFCTFMYFSSLDVTSTEEATLRIKSIDTVCCSFPLIVSPDILHYEAYWDLCLRPEYIGSRENASMPQAEIPTIGFCLRRKWRIDELCITWSWHKYQLHICFLHIFFPQTCYSQGSTSSSYMFIL